MFHICLEERIKWLQYLFHKYGFQSTKPNRETHRHYHQLLFHISSHLTSSNLLENKLYSSSGQLLIATVSLISATKHCWRCQWKYFAIIPLLFSTLTMLKTSSIVLLLLLNLYCRGFLDPVSISEHSLHNMSFKTWQVKRYNTNKVFLKLGMKIQSQF